MDDAGEVEDMVNDGGRRSEGVDREELQVDLPMDWDDLKWEVLVRDDGECAICGTGADERQLYVLYARPPSHLSRMQPSEEDIENPEAATTDVEVPGYGTENMVTVCEIHAVGGRKDERTVVVPDEARAARETSLDELDREDEVSPGGADDAGADEAVEAPESDGDGDGDGGTGTGTGVGAEIDGDAGPDVVIEVDEDADGSDRSAPTFEVDDPDEVLSSEADGEESGFDRDAMVEGGVSGAEVGFPGADSPGTDGGSEESDGLASRFGMADEFSSAMDAVPGGGEGDVGDSSHPSGSGGGGGNGVRPDGEMGAVSNESVEGGSGGRPDGGDASDASSHVSDDEEAPDVDFYRKFNQRRFGLHLPFVGRALRVLRAVVWIAVSLSVSSGVVGALMGGSIEAGASMALTVGGMFVGIGEWLVTAPVVILALFAVGYGVHLWYRDGVYSMWPVIRESPSPSVAGRHLVVAAGMTTVVGAAVTLYGGLLSLGAETASMASPTGIVVAVAYVVGIGFTMKVMSDAVVADRKAGSTTRSFAWEFAVRVGGVLGAVIAVTGVFKPSALVNSVVPVALVPGFAVASVLVAPVVALVYVVRRRSWPTTRGVSVEVDPDARF